MDFQKLLTDFSAMTTHQQVTLGIAVLALFLSFYNILHNRSLRESEWLIASAHTAAETLAIAKDTISLAGNTKILVRRSAAFQGLQENSRVSVHIAEVDDCRQTAEKCKDLAHKSLERITSWWFPKLFIVSRLVRLAKAKHDVQTAHALLIRKRTDIMAEDERAQARALVGSGSTGKR